MTRFNFIQTTDPFPFEQQIFDFWDAYLPDTPHGRLNWMGRGNPAGPATWLLALNGDSRELVGTISVMPKDYFVGSRSFRAGIVGDFMVHTKHRVFGPAVSLQKFISEHYRDLGFDFLYTVPNAKSAKVAAHVGYKPANTLFSHLKPIIFTPYLQRYMPHAMARSLSPLARIGSMLLSWRAYLSASGFFQEVSKFDEVFDEIFARVRAGAEMPLSDHGSEYLKWRYFSNPLFSFRVLTVRESSDSLLSGYLIFSITHDRLVIFDGLAMTVRDKRSLLREIGKMAARENCRAIEFTVSESGEWSRQLEICGFLPVGGKDHVHCIGQPREFVEGWEFMPGEKNI